MEKNPVRRICIVHGWDDPLSRITTWGILASHKEILQCWCGLVPPQELSLYEMSNMKDTLMMDKHLLDSYKEGFAW